uniref:Uncharacterized protein n=1 Tax=Ralstonia solanacearum TaxID=305 RepID=A0A0S4VC42_RALSL|nr:protein of unknown function [Ralstonia solanacearum]
MAGGKATLIATGAKDANGNPVAGTGNLTIAGSGVSAKDVVLGAANAVNLVASQDTDKTRSENSSSSASVGICLLYTSPSPRDATLSRMPSSA